MAVGVGAEQMGAVVGADGLDRGLGAGGFDQFGQRHAERLRDALTRALDRRVAA